MLNRRTLRIKIMQSLFAFEQCKEANYELSLERLDHYFEPDLNSMEVQDKELLKGRNKKARKLLEDRFLDPATSDLDDIVVNNAVTHSMTEYHRQVNKDFQYFSKNMVLEVERINELYFSVLGLFTTLAEAASHDRKADYSNFIHSPWVEAIGAHAELKKHLSKDETGWQKKEDQVRTWFRDIFRGDVDFLKFLQIKSPSGEEHRAVVKHIVRKLILGKGPINAYFEEEDIRWSEDQEIVKSLVDKTLKTLKDESKTIELQKLSMDWEDDREFMIGLFAGATSLKEEHKQLIARNTKNWEVDRLPLTDRIILEMAISELISFSHIPVKVSINEYIELAKNYSTPKSRQFVNGILDVIAKELQQSGEMKKSGRGLIDNK